MSLRPVVSCYSRGSVLQNTKGSYDHCHFIDIDKTMPQSNHSGLKVCPLHDPFRRWMEGHYHHHNLGLRPSYTTKVGQKYCLGEQRYFFFIYRGASALPSQEFLWISTRCSLNQWPNIKMLLSGEWGNKASNSWAHPKGPHSTELLTLWDTNYLGAEEGSISLA
jgi:hypothetical protein